MKKILIGAFLILSGTASYAQVLHPVTWSYGAKKINDKTAVLFLKATIEDGWHVYSQNVADGGPVKTTFTFNTARTFRLIGPVTEPKAITRFEKVFNLQVSYFEREVIFQQKIALTGTGPVTVAGTLEYMTCNDKQCLPPEDVNFSIPVK